VIALKEERIFQMKNKKIIMNFKFDSIFFSLKIPPSLSLSFSRETEFRPILLSKKDKVIVR